MPRAWCPPPWQKPSRSRSPIYRTVSIRRGHSFSTDPNIVKSGSNYLLELNGSVVPTATSTIPVSNTNSSETPIVPHVSTVNEGITYTVYTYPTTDTAAPGLVTVVVVVTWKAPNGGAQRVVGEDGIAAP